VPRQPSPRVLGWPARLALAAALAAPAPALQGSDPRAEVARILEADTGAGGPAARAGEIAVVPGAARAWLALRGEGTLRAEGFEALSEDQELVLGLAAPLLPRAEALLAAKSVARSDAPSVASRLAALELAGCHASASELDLVAALARPDQEDPEPAMAPAFEAALAEVLGRDQRSYDALDALVARDPELSSSVARAVGRAGQAAGLEWLAGRVDDPLAGSAALQEVERLAPRAAQELAAEVAEAVRPILRGEDSARRKHAMRTLGALGDDASVPDLLAFLAQGEPGERQAAHAALRAITGRNLPARADLWLAWYQGELRWLREQGPALLERLASADEAAVLAAARSLAERGLYRAQAAEHLARLLAEHPSPAVRAEACSGLERLGARFQLQALAGALDDEDPAVSAAAHASLRALTGLALPPDPEAWSAALAAR
jgi:HEAT repeat protein